MAFRRGDEVYIVGKSIYGSLAEYYRTHQFEIFKPIRITEVLEPDKDIGSRHYEIDGNYFLDCDLLPVNDNTTIPARKILSKKLGIEVIELGL